MAAEVDEEFFNDLSRQPTVNHDSSASPQDQACFTEHGDQSDLPKTKRIACVVCRKRKLKCDGNRPKCATCARLGHNCAYDEARRKSGPKRGYVKELEARLGETKCISSTKTAGSDRLHNAAQVETQLKGKSKKGKPAAPERQLDIPEEIVVQPPDPKLNPPMPDSNNMSLSGDPYANMPSAPSPYPAADPSMMPEAMATSNFAPEMNFTLDDNFSWEMIGLGLDEPMPEQEAIDELTNVYFEKIHPSLPVLHRYRYYGKMNLAPQARPPICLRYTMWALAAAITEKYMHHADIFYRRARKYLEQDEMKGAGESFVSLGHAQAWILMCAFEFKMMYFPRAWMSVGRACRMVLMMGLNRLDGGGMDVKQCLPPPADWTEREERRRTFWMAFCVDRYASIGTGWPMVIDERDIMTVLPSTEEAYENCVQQSTCRMGDGMSHQQISTLSSFAGVIYITHFFGMNLTHLHRPEPDDEEDNAQGKFWKRHRRMDNILSNTSLSLPSHLRLPNAVRNPNCVFLNFSIHTSTICLHQAAIFKAEKNKMPPSFISHSRTRCLLAAQEISNIMRLTSHLDVTGMNPFMAFCLYVAARVFVQYLKVSPEDTDVKQSLEFLLTAMAALRRKNPLSESFMIQLNLDIDASGLDILLHNPDFSSLVKEKLKGSCAPGLAPESQDTNGQSDPAATSPHPADVRIPNSRIYNVSDQSNSASIRSESPRQSQYALNNLQLNSRDTRPTNPYFPEDHPSMPQGLEGILPGVPQPQNAWGKIDGLMPANENPNAPVGLNPIINNNIATAAAGFDTDMSDQSHLSRHNSQGLTPQSSHGAHTASSNTSYSPPQVQDDDPLTSAAATAAMQQQARGTSTMSMLEDAFQVPPGWDMNGNGTAYAGTGSTPGFSGMTPGSADWENLMQNMNWEGTGMTPK